MTKEEKKEYARKYYQANKEKLLAGQKKYYKANKEEYAAYYQANKEKMDANNKIWYEAKKDGYYTVYYLKEEHYAGMTNILKWRLYKHKTHSKRHIEDVEIIGKYKTKEEATRVEAALHAMDYLGRHPKHKQQTLTQLI